MRNLVGEIERDKNYSKTCHSAKEDHVGQTRVVNFY